MNTPGRPADLNNLGPPTGELPTDAGMGCNCLPRKRIGGRCRPPIEWCVVEFGGVWHWHVTEILLPRTESQGSRGRLI